MKDYGNILDATYADKKIAKTLLPLIQWSQKEMTSIRVGFQNTLANTNVWLLHKGIQLKSFNTRS